MISQQFEIFGIIQEIKIEIFGIFRQKQFEIFGNLIYTKDLRKDGNLLCIPIYMTMFL